MDTVFHGIVLLLFFHWVADFICQSDWMANNKSKSLAALSSHVIVYTAVLGFGTYILFAHGIPQAALVMFVAVNGVLHFCTDFVTSRISAALWKAGDKHNFFVIVGFDQLIHCVTVILTAQYFLF